MTNAKHTPGSWIAAKKHSSKVGLPVVASPNGRSIASVTFFGLGENFKNHDEESYANARLISAAPDMLEALKGLLDSMEMENPLAHKTQIDAARAAIAKAEGR